MSQREGNFKGGIQTGEKAWDADSLKLDQFLKECRDEIPTKNFVMKKQFTKQDKIDLVGDDCFGFAPDGGAWFWNGKLVAVFEAKKQNEGGNAYERWWDNAATAQYINPDVYYVTFCTGKGAATDKCLDKLRRKAKIMAGKNFQFYLNEDGFTKQEVFDIMKKVLEKCID